MIACHTILSNVGGLIVVCSDTMLHFLFNIFSMHGDNLQGAKLYRKALYGPNVHTRFPPEMIQMKKMSLVLAQMQCPEMPLDADKYTILNCSKDEIHYILKKDQDRCNIQRKINEENGTESGRLVSLKEGELPVLGVLVQPLPTDPNDPEIFTPEFLATLLTEN